METFVADLQYALRMLRKNPGFTAIAVAALALGIGANTAIFTVVDAVLLKPLPYPEPDRIVRLERQYPNGHADSVSIPKYMAWRNNRVFESMCLYGQTGPGMNLGSGDRPEQVKSLQVSEGYFRVFGVAPQVGRAFSAAEDAPNGPAVVVVSHSLWQSRLGGDTAIIGHAILLAGKPYTVVGILPRGFQSDPAADVWLPLQADPDSTNQGNYLAAAARLKPGIELSTARAEMKVAGARFRQANPKWMGPEESVAVTPMQESIVGDARSAILILLGAVLFVLLIACANVANLLLARAAVRQREMAVRAAIGASRGRVVRQLLTESVLLAGIGGVLGLVLGSWGVRALMFVAPGDIPRLRDADGLHAVVPPLDWRVTAFTLGVAVLTGILFGLFPALHTSKPDLASVLKEGGGRTGTARRQNRARGLLVVTEVALALVLLVGATLLIRTFVGLRSVRPGYDPHNVLTLQTSLSGVYTTTAKVDDFVTQMQRRLEGLPGVEASASALLLPTGGDCDLPFNIVGRPPEKGEYNGDEQYRTISPHYFNVMRIPLRRGRVFRETDTANSAKVLVINEAMAKRYWKKEDPIGQVVLIGRGLGPEFDDQPRQIVGVVGAVRETDLDQGDQAVMYVPQSQVPEGITALANRVIPLSWAIRTVADPNTLRAAVERQFRSGDVRITVSRERTMEQLIGDKLARQNFNMLLLSIFAGVALLLAAIGIYGLMSYSVEQRAEELWIRMALGAARTNVLRLVLLDGMKLAAIGVAAGLAIAFGTTRLLASLLYGVKASDPPTFAAVAGLLLLTAALATFVPARRASR